MARETSTHQELRDLALTALGFGVMTFQRLQVRRRQVEKEMRRRMGRSAA